MFSSAPQFGKIHAGRNLFHQRSKENFKMKLMDITRRSAVPQPWAEGEKIPWNDPDFSQRMLQEHLSQEHDAASRRLRTIDEHVEWIHTQILSGEPGKILDLGCGPGLYTSRLARYGHTCTGIDYSPASIAYAREHAVAEQLPCTYIQKDIREADYGKSFDLVMLIFGEFNVFNPSDARKILARAAGALKPGACLLLEAFNFSAVKQMVAQGTSWYSAQSGLFSDRPHLCLIENFWDAELHVATERYFIIDADSGSVNQQAASTQAYTNDEYHKLLEEAGFTEVLFNPSLSMKEEQGQSDFMAIMARKAG
jgi:2-polyprenyl-3-methyl-5-hydroxy-6-metoxy-1,4-benzoquinol methylase